MHLKRLDKRGQEDKLYFVIWESLAFLAVMIIIIAAVRGIVTKNTYWKKYYTSDLAMISDLENTNQGDFVINYELKDMKQGLITWIFFVQQKAFETTLKSDRIEMNEAGATSLPMFYPYAKHPLINVIENSVSSNFLVLFTENGNQELKTYHPESEDSCISLNTGSDITLLKFESLSLSAETSKYTDSITAVLKHYGEKLPQSANYELRIFLVYEPKPSGANPPAESKFTIYYSDDKNTLKSQKLACLLSQTIKQKNLETEFLKYDGSLGQNTAFLEKTQDNADNAFWIILKTNDVQSISQNDFAINIINPVLKEYYK